MDIEELVKKYYAQWNSHSMTMCQALESALTEQAETHAIEMRAYEATVQNQAERIRQMEAMAINNGQQAVLLGERVKQLEAERVPEVWRPIETAPKDGTHILIKSPTMPPTTVHWFEGDWHLSVNQRGEYSSYIWCGPNFWRPLPSTVAAPAKEGE